MGIIPQYEKKSLGDVVISYIENKILSGELKSGDKLIEADISKELNTSRAPVREALRVLGEQGIIIFSPRKGNQVLEMSPAEIIEVFEIRVSLEMQILYLLVTQRILKDEDYADLKRMVDEMKIGASQCTSEEERIFLLNRLDLDFHSYLWKVSGSTRRAQLLEPLFYQLLIIMNLNTSSLGSFEEKAKEHDGIIEALKSNDLNTAQEELRIHLQSYVVAALTGSDRDVASIQPREIPLNISCFI